MSAYHEWERVTNLTRRFALPGIGWLYCVLGSRRHETNAPGLVFVPDPQGLLRGGTDAHAWPDETAPGPVPNDLRPLPPGPTPTADEYGRPRARHPGRTKAIAGAVVLVAPDDPDIHPSDFDGWWNRPPTRRRRWWQWWGS